MFDALFDRRRENLRNTAGLIVSHFYNSNPWRGKDAPTLTPLDFFPDGKPKQNGMQTPEEQARILTAVLGVGPNKRLMD